MFSILIVIGSILAFLLGWNNSGMIITASYGSGVLGYNRSRIVASLGVIVGAFMEGAKMNHTLFGGLISSELQSSNVSTAIVLTTLITSIIVLFAFSMVHVPSSLSLLAVGASVGAIIGLNLALQVNYLAVLVAAWLFLPFISGILTMFVYQLVIRTVSKLSLPNADLVTELSVVLGIFVVSYALGANNVGFINGLYRPLVPQSYQSIVILVISVSTIMGIVLLGRTITESIGEKLVVLSSQGVFTSMTVSAALVWILTQWGMPVSITHVLIGSIIGAALTKQISMINRRVSIYDLVWGNCLNSSELHPGSYNGDVPCLIL